MKCPYCGKEMISGVVCPDNWIAPISTAAYHCSDCKKVVIDYSEE